MMTILPVIPLSPDVHLQLLEEQDAPALFALTDRNRQHLREWLPWLDITRDVRDTHRFILHTLEQRKQQQGLHYGIWCRGELAGTLGVHAINWQHRRTEIGYWLGQDFQGMGLMTEAVAAYIDRLIFGAWQLHRVQIYAATGNWRSRAIPERLGFQLEGIMRQNELLYDRWVDHAVYGLLATEWNQR